RVVEEVARPTFEVGGGGAAGKLGSEPADGVAFVDDRVSGTQTVGAGEVLGHRGNLSAGRGNLPLGPNGGRGNPEQADKLGSSEADGCRFGGDFVRAQTVFAA